MTLLRLVVLIAAFTASSSAADPPTPSPADSAADNTCPITRGGASNDHLRAIVPATGAKYTFAPGGSGFVDRDGALGIKFGWERFKKGHMIVGGRRLDAPAKGARAYISDYGDIGFQPMYLVFPTPGCWEITGKVGDGSLTFVVEVEQIGEGPDWKFDGLDLGWRITMLPDQVWQIVRGQERPVRVQ